LPLTQTQVVTAVAERAELSKADAKRALEALDQIVLEELGNAQKVRIGGLVQLTVRVKPAQKARKGRNPATGEEITIAAKPAAVDLRARPLARAKAALPTVQKSAPAARRLKRLLPPISTGPAQLTASIRTAGRRRSSRPGRPRPRRLPAKCR
jgi:DNA-binding protein HU-beta